MKTIFYCITVLLATSTFLISSAIAGHLGRITTDNTLRVCHWPAYYGISYVNTKNGHLEGIDIDLAKELALDLKVELQFIKTSFATFIDDIKADKCDIAMFGVGVTQERLKHLSFSERYLCHYHKSPSNR